MEQEEIIPSRKPLLEVVVHDGLTNPRRGRIGKVPLQLRNHKSNKGEYDPKVVSIGPYHHGKPELSLMEDLKPMVARVYVSDSGKDLDEFYNKVLLMVDDARSFYAEGSTNKYSDAQFAEMMLLDGCFILGMIEMFVGPDYAEQYNTERVTNYDVVRPHLSGLVFSTVSADTVLCLENQLPFQVLELLMSLKFKENNGWMKIIHADLGGFTSLNLKFDFTEVKTSKQPPLHLLELFRTKLLSVPLPGDQVYHRKRTRKNMYYKSIKQLFRRRKQSAENITHIQRFVHSFRSVTELKAKGIHFRPSNSTSFNDMNFKSFCFYGLLELPKFRVTGNTKRMLMNLVAYELCQDYRDYRGICSHVAFMKSLIDRPDDVKELRSKHIMFNSLGSDEEVASVYKDLLSFPAEDTKIYMEVKQRIEDHYNSKAKTWMAELIHNYFSSPWTVIAFLAATSAIVLTFIQTYLAIYPRSAK